MISLIGTEMSSRLFQKGQQLLVPAATSMQLSPASSALQNQRHLLLFFDAASPPPDLRKRVADFYTSHHSRHHFEVVYVPFVAPAGTDVSPVDSMTKADWNQLPFPSLPPDDAVACGPAWRQHLDVRVLPAVVVLAQSTAPVVGPHTGVEDAAHGDDEHCLTHTPLRRNGETMIFKDPKALSFPWTEEDLHRAAQRAMWQRLLRNWVASLLLIWVFFTFYIGKQPKSKASHYGPRI